jgi:hypothetical protein
MLAQVAQMLSCVLHPALAIPSAPAKRANAGARKTNGVPAAIGNPTEGEDAYLHIGGQLAYTLASSTSAVAQSGGLVDRASRTAAPRDRHHWSHGDTRPARVTEEEEDMKLFLYWAVVLLAIGSIVGPTSGAILKLTDGPWWVF